MNTSKIIKGVVGGGRYTVTAPIIKEDYGLYLQIDGIELPETYEVDFSNDEHSGSSVTMIGNSDGVLIPSQFIKSGKDVFAFLYHVGADYGRTIFKFRIPNKLRPDRTNEEPTPEEQSVIDQAIAALNTAVEKTAQDVIDADESARSAAESADRAERAKTGAETAQRKSEEAQESAEIAKDDAETSERNASESERKAKGYAETASEKADSIHSMTASAQTLPAGSSATASYNAETGVMSFGIPKGDKGDKGDRGEQGIQGIQGERGLIGAKGDKGDKGDTGAQGIQGIQGEKGEQGIQGEKGEKGDKGDKGDTGEVTTEEFLKAFVTDSASGSIASFPDGADGIPLKSLVVDINPIQDTSSGDPSPENICPISGWTEVDVEQSGKNVLSSEIVHGLWTTEGRFYSHEGSSSKYLTTKTKIPVVGGLTYLISYSDDANNIVASINFLQWKGNDPLRQQYVNTRTGKISIPNDVDHITINFILTTPITMISSVSTGSFQLELGSTATPYEPYTGRSITIDLGQTVYGGKLDVLSGVLTVDRAMYTLDGTEQWSQTANYCYIFGYAQAITNGGATQIGSHYLTTYSYNVGDFLFAQTNGAIVKSNRSDKGAWKAELVQQASAGTPVQLCYKLATPIEMQLSTNQVNSLLGANNIWADTGDTTAEYRADTKLYIEKLTQPEEDDMIADSAITSGQFFMVGNTLYRALANIASGATITVGTNAQRVSLSDALNLVNA